MKSISKFIAMIIMYLITFGCSPGYQVPDYEKLADKITAKTGKNLEKKYNLHLIGTGGGMMDDIKRMGMSFDLYYEVDLKTARVLLVNSVREYLSDINGNEELRQYLHNYPFTAKNVEIQIWIHNPDRSGVSLGKIRYVSAFDGVLKYYIQGTEKCCRQTVCEETYEEAVKLVSSP